MNLHEAVNIQENLLILVQGAKKRKLHSLTVHQEREKGEEEANLVIFGPFCKNELMSYLYKEVLMTLSIANVAQLILEIAEK